MPRKQQHCATCQTPCRGIRCMACAQKVPGGTRGFKSVNSVGEFNAGSPSGIAIPKVAPTVGAWWASAPQTGFTALGEQHAPRMSSGPAANHRVDTAHWTI